MKEDNGKKYGNTPEQLKEKLDNLKKIISIIHSDKDGMDKAYEVYKIYNVSKCAEKFRSSYSLISKTGQEDPDFCEYIVYFESIYNILLGYEAKGYFEVAKSKAKIEPYLNNYAHAKEVMTIFMLNGHTYELDEFLVENEMTKSDFDFCLKTIKVLDEELSAAYDRKVESDKVFRYTKNINACMDIAHAIKTGYFLDGTEFEMLEFWKRVPFKRDDLTRSEFFGYSKINPKIVWAATCLGRVDNFTKVTMPEGNNVIMNFVKNSGLKTKGQHTSELNLKIMYGGNRRFTKFGVDENGNSVIISDVCVNDDDLDNMIKYMRIHKLPFFLEVYKIVEKKYIAGEIDKAEIEKSDVKNMYSKKKNR